MNKAEYLKQIDEVIAKGPFTDDWESLCRHETPHWYMRDKFGIFIHWGAYSVPAFGNEWYPRNMYRKNSPEYLHHKKIMATLPNLATRTLSPFLRRNGLSRKNGQTYFARQVHAL